MSDSTVTTSGARWQTAHVSDIIRQTPTIKSFFFDLPDPMTFVAGQHVDVRLTAPDGYSAVRSYSIASAPESHERIELAIEVLQNGEVSPFFHETVQVSDAIDLRGPLGGHFIWSSSYGGPLLLVGGGSGLVPLLSMLRHRKSIDSGVPALLLLSARTWDDIPFRDELLELDRNGDGFQLVLTLTRERRHRPDDYDRRVDSDMMGEVLQRLPAAPKFTYACGSNMFVDTAIDAIIAAGIPKEADIRTERYGA